MTTSIKKIVLGAGAAMLLLSPVAAMADIASDLDSVIANLQREFDYETALNAQDSSRDRTRENALRALIAQVGKAKEALLDVKKGGPEKAAEILRDVANKLKELGLTSLLGDVENILKQLPAAPPEEPKQQQQKPAAPASASKPTNGGGAGIAPSHAPRNVGLAPAKAKAFAYSAASGSCIGITSGQERALTNALTKRKAVSRAPLPMVTVNRTKYAVTSVHRTLAACRDAAQREVPAVLFAPKPKGPASEEKSVRDFASANLKAIDDIENGARAIAEALDEDARAEALNAAAQALQELRKSSPKGEVKTVRDLQDYKSSQADAAIAVLKGEDKLLGELEIALGGVEGNKKVGERAQRVKKQVVAKRKAIRVMLDALTGGQ